jgi:hypothetical protein
MVNGGLRPAAAGPVLGGLASSKTNPCAFSPRKLR